MKSFTINGFVKKLLSILLSIALIFSFLPSLGNTKQVQAEEAQTAVQQGDVKSEEELLEQADGVPVSPEDEQGNLFSGGIHRLFDRSDINYKNNANNGTTKNGTLSSTLPSQVDLRNFNGQNRVRSVKNQASTGGCWSFAANAVSETSIATSLNAAAQTDYSTFQTHYFVYDSLSSNTAQLKGSEVSQAGEGIKWASDALKKEYLLMCGGTTYHASSVFMQGVGPANATEIPFADTSGELTTTLTPDNRRSCLAHLSKWSYLGSLITTKLDASGNTTYDSTDEAVLNNAKTELANGNPIELTYCGDNRSSWWVQYYINTDTYAQYTYEYQSPNHAVCVVGYDDNYSKDNFISGHQPDRDGAFIVKNSWGSGWGNSGYFYLSYWDQSITDLTTYVYDTSNYDGSNIDVDKEEVIDQYDYMAADDIYKPGSQTGIAEWYSNVFTASKNQSLHSIGTYYCSNGQNLSYKVYKLKSNATSPSDVEGTLATPAAQGTYSNPYEGYVSIDLATPVELKKGDKYAIWISQKDDDGDYCAPQTMAWASGDDLSNNTHVYDVNAVVNTGESFFRASGSSTWTGFSTEQIGQYVFDNYCVKGYSTVKPYEVNFYSNGYLYSNRQAYDGETVTLPYANPDKTGYWFAGWYKDEACTQTWNSSSAITEDTNLYAKFNPNVYYVWFYDGYTTFDTQQIEYNSYATEPDPAPTKAGYHFLMDGIPKMVRLMAIGGLSSNAAALPSEKQNLSTLNGATLLRRTLSHSKIGMVQL